MQSGDAFEGDPDPAARPPLLPEYETDPAEPDFDAEMADAIVAARRDEFAALDDLNDEVDWNTVANR